MNIRSTFFSSRLRTVGLLFFAASFAPRASAVELPPAPAADAAPLTAAETKVFMKRLAQGLKSPLGRKVPAIVTLPHDCIEDLGPN